MGLEELADQEFYSGDVPAHLENRAVFLSVGEIKRVNRPRTDVLLSNYTCEKTKRKSRLMETLHIYIFKLDSQVQCLSY